MPFYEYLCRDCEYQFDALQKISEDALKDCPECMAPTLTKLVSAPSFRLSGTGWYETDFKTGKDKKKNLTDSRATAASSPEKKTEEATAKAEKPKGADRGSPSAGTKKTGA